MSKNKKRSGKTAENTGKPPAVLDRVLYICGAILFLILLYSFITLDKETTLAFFRASRLFTIPLVLYVLCTFLYVANTFFVKSRPVFIAGSAVFWIALAFNIASIVHRWIQAGRPPFKTYYESLILLAACTAAVYLVLEIVNRVRIVGPFASLICSGSYIIALSKLDEEIIELPAALQSFWFIPHVLLYFVAYASLGIAFGSAIVYLITPGVKILSKRNALLFGDREMDFYQYTYKIIVFGFIFLSLGLVTGGIWAKSAWGDYWVWDPKENWSLITWLIYLVFLHLRSIKGWKGRRAIIFSIIGFCAVIFCYLLMNYLPTAIQSDHVYSG
ncbi:cytochrome c biogenesis protein CcsA [Acidobacteriota bacterium]